MRYGLITGSGRSGTNWLLDMLDASPVTHCRNEPHVVDGTAISRFPMVWQEAGPPTTQGYREHWDAVAAETARRRSRRDHGFRYRKSYLRSVPWWLGITRGARRQVLVSRARQWHTGADWEMSSWVCSRRRLSHGVGVIKLIVDPHLTSWLVAERAHVPIVHLVRHPAGRMHSWTNRLVATRSPQKRAALLHDRTSRLARIRDVDERWHDLVPPPGGLDLFEAEMWFWRYVNETVWEAGAGHDSYLMMRFEDLAGDPLPQARAVFEHMGVPWDAEVAARVQADTQRSAWGPVEDSRGVAHTWRSAMTEHDLATIDRVLAGSSLADLLA